MCRRNNRKRQKVWAEFEASKAGGEDGPEEEEDVVENVKIFVAKSEGAKRCCTPPPGKPIALTADVGREHEEKRQEARGRHATRLSRDADMLHSHRIREESEWQDQGSKLYHASPSPCKWPPISGEPASFCQLDEVSKARKIDECFQHLESLPGRVQTCPTCLQRTHFHGAPAEIAGVPGHQCRNCAQHPNGWQVHLAHELDMDPSREIDPARKAAKEEWAALLNLHGPLLPTEECLLSPVLCFVKVLYLRVPFLLFDQNCTGTLSPGAISLI